MRFTRVELSPANKRQYTMAMGKKDIELLHEIALMAHRYTPNTAELRDSKRRLASIGKAFAAAMETVEYDSDEGDKLPLAERQKYKNALEANPLAEVTRLEIISGTGRSLIFDDVRKEVISSVQDKGRTLKLFVEDRTEPIGGCTEGCAPERGLFKLGEIDKIIEMLQSNRMK